MSTPKKRRGSTDEPRDEYDFSRGIRGKYALSYSQGTNVVLLSREVSRGFPTAESVNHALRAQMAWKSLTPKERQVLVLQYYEQVSDREIGKILGLSQVRIERIRAKVRKRLRDGMQTLVTELLAP